MKVLANSCVVPPSTDEGHGQAPGRRKSAKAQLRFADTAALVGTRKPAQTDKEVTDKAVVSAGARREPGTPVVRTHAGALVPRNRKSQSTPDNGQAAMAGAWSAPPAAVPVRMREDDPTLSSAAMPPTQIPSKESPEVKTPSDKAADGPLDRAVGGPPIVWRAAHSQPAEVLSRSQERSVGATVPANEGARRPRQDQPEVQAARSGPAARERLSPQNSHVDDQREAASIPETEPQGARKEEPAAGASAPVERAQVPPAGNGKVVPNAGPNAPFPTRPASEDDSPADVPKPDQTPPKTSPTRQDPTIEAPRKSAQSPPQFRREDQGLTASRREDTPVRQHRQREVAEPDDKKTLPELRTEGAKTPLEPWAAAVGQSTTVASHASGGPPIQGSVDIGTGFSVVRTVSEQILDGVRASVTQGEGQISVRLQPPELGTVTVRLRERGDRLEGTVEVEKSDTRREIERALPDVVRSLQDAGIQVRHLNVTGGDSPKPDLGPGAGPQDGASGQNGGGQNRDHLPAPPTPWPQEAGTYPVRSEETARAGRPSTVPPGRIDMLL